MSAERRTHIEQTIRGYFDACNEGDGRKIAAYFHPDAVHYFPEGAFAPMRGPAAIAAGWKKCVAEWDSRWTIDRMIIEAESSQAVIEWTHWKPKLGTFLRGDEWYRFAEDGTILEIRAYYASPTHSGRARHELGGYDYEGVGFSTTSPAVTRKPD